MTWCLGEELVLHHQKRDRQYVTGPRMMTGPSYDTVRLYETIAGEDLPSSTGESCSANSDSRGYMHMSSCMQQTDSGSVPENSEVQSNPVTGEYMEMKRQNLSSVGEQDEGNAETSRYANTFN